MTSRSSDRRPLRSRDSGWARGAAERLAMWNVSPDAVSAGSVVCAAIGCAAFVASGRAPGVDRPAALALAVILIQGRLVCNLLDGMVALEHGRGGSSGAIWNELPDRVSDILLLVGAGYGAAIAGTAWAVIAGWAAAILAVITAYVRELGRGLGQPADFCGPGAKPHRMAALTAATVVACLTEPRWLARGNALGLGLALIACLSLITVIRRTRHLAARLATRS